MVNITHAFVHPASDGPDPDIVQPGDWNAAHTVPTRVRRKDLSPWLFDGAGFTPAIDTHGTLDGMHTDGFADAANHDVRFDPVVVDDDFVAGTWKMVVMWSKSTASGNVRVQPSVTQIVDGATSETSLLNAVTTMAAPGAANTIEVTSFDFTSNPTAGGVLSPYFGTPRNHADDTADGAVTIWKVWLERTAPI